MPKRPPKQCIHFNCTNYAEPGHDYCIDHIKPKGWGESTAPYTSDPEYRKFRAWYLRQHPICERCKREPSDTLHHKTPVNEGGALMDPDNAMALCRDCHEIVHGRKGGKED